MINYAVTRTSPDELKHHGIKGQKWGVRRFQNEDGSLTEAGRARVAQTAGYGYLNPTYKDIKKGKAKARNEVRRAYDDEFWDHVRKGMPTDSPTAAGKRLWNAYKDKYAAATLKDLKLSDTEAARKSVKKLLSEIDHNYAYTHKVDDDNGLYNEKREQQFKNRRNRIEHPTQTKVANVAKKTGSAIKVAADVAKILS